MNNQKPSYRIKDLDHSERPRERLARLGAKALSTAELLAILIRVGIRGENAVQIGHRLLNTFDGLAGFHRVTYNEICSQRGIGPAKAAQVLAAVELGCRLNSLSPQDRPSINSPEDAADLVRYEMSALQQEELRVILLNTRNRVLSMETIYRGSLNSSQVRVAEIFKPAINANAAAIIIVHNHPSGDPTPSPDDLTVTRAIIEAGKLMDIDVLDHLVIGQTQYISLKERKLGFSD